MYTVMGHPLGNSFGDVPSGVYTVMGHPLGNGYVVVDMLVEWRVHRYGTPTWQQP